MSERPRSVSIGRMMFLHLLLRAPSPARLAYATLVCQRRGEGIHSPGRVPPIIVGSKWLPLLVRLSTESCVAQLTGLQLTSSLAARKLVRRSTRKMLSVGSGAAVVSPSPAADHRRSIPRAQWTPFGLSKRRRRTGVCTTAVRRCSGEHPTRNSTNSATCMYIAQLFLYHCSVLSVTH